MFLVLKTRFEPVSAASLPVDGLGFGQRLLGLGLELEPALEPALVVRVPDSVVSDLGSVPVELIVGVD